MAVPNQELVLEIKQEPAWPEERSSNQGFKEGDEIISPQSPDSQGTENIEMVDLDNESAIVEDLGDEWAEDEASNLCDPLAHMTSEALGSPDSSEGGSKRGTQARGAPHSDVKGGAAKKTSKGLPKATPTRSSSRLSSQGAKGQTHDAYVELEDLSDNPNSPGKRNDTDSPLMKRRRKAPRLVLSEEQEESVVDWLQTYPELFDKGNKRYKDIDYKTKLWDDKAAELGLASGEHLQVWYKSMRTRFGKLKRVRSMGDRNRDYTYRDKWIMKNFEFISPHIYACPRGSSFNSVSQALKQNRQPRPQSGTEDDDNDDDFYTMPNSSTAGHSISASAGSRGPLKFDASQFVPLPEPTLQGLSAHGAAGNLLTGLSPDIHSSQGNGMAKGYGTFLSTVATSLHPSLLTQFYQESWAVVMKYHMESEKLKEKEQQGLPATVSSLYPPP